jgi:hypothetical protein
VTLVADNDSCLKAGSLVQVRSSAGYRVSTLGFENLSTRFGGEAGFEIYCIASALLDTSPK